MSQEVKVTIEWDGNAAGLHADPMTVHIAGKADPNEIIGAVAKAMGAKEKHEPPKCEDDDSIRLYTKDNNVPVIKDGERHSFPSWQVTCD